MLFESCLKFQQLTQVRSWMALGVLYLGTFSLQAISQLPHFQLQGSLSVRLVLCIVGQSVLVVMPDRQIGRQLKWWG